MMKEDLTSRARLVKGTGCLVWNGQLSISMRPVYKDKLADQWQWEREYGKIPEGFSIYHSCPHSDCINVKHLYIKPAFIENEKESVQRIKTKRGLKVIRDIKKKRRKPRNYQIRSIPYTTSEDVKKYFVYEKDALRWKVAQHGTYVGQIAGALNKAYGIRVVSLNSTLYRLEDLVWIYHHGPLFEHERIVPINGDTSDCRIENLHKIEVFPSDNKTRR